MRQSRIFIWGLLCMGLNVGVRGQSVVQLLEQLLIDRQKLAEMKAVLKDMRDGYESLNRGYIEIREIAHGNFNLHKAFLDALLVVSPAVRGYYRVAAILTREQQMIGEYVRAEARWRAAGVFHAGELGLLHDAYALTGKKAEACLDRLTMVLTDGKLRMSDAQRMQAIDRIDRDVGDIHMGLRQYNEQVAVQALQRARERNDILSMKRLYNDTP